MSSSLCEGFTFDERLGIYFTVQSSALSVAAVLVLLSYAAIRWWRRRRSMGPEAANAEDADASGSSLFLNLMLADILQAAGSMPSIAWMRTGFVTEGSLCTAQAVLKQVGINNVALSSLFIALHTFAVLILRWRIPKHAIKFTVLGIWVVVALLVGIPNAIHRNDRFYGPTGYWCWIRTEYRAAQIMSEYIWVWASGFIMAILYGVMALVMQGYLSVGGGKGIKWVPKSKRVQFQWMDADSDEERAAKHLAKVLLFYPLVYICCFFPNTLSRWLAFSHKTNPTYVPHQYTLFASSIFQLSGLFNVILYFSPRREYAVGPSANPEVHAALPNEGDGRTAVPPSPNGSTFKVDESHELEKMYGTATGRNISYQTGNSDFQGANGGGVVQRGSRETPIVYQSPQSRTMSLGSGGTHGAHSTANQHLSPLDKGLTRTQGQDDGLGRLPY